MNIQNLLSNFSQNQNSAQHGSSNHASDSLSSLTSMLPSGLAGGAAAGGVMALLLGSKSTRKMAKKVAKYGGTAIVGGLAYKAYDNWQKNKALGQTKPLERQDIELVTSDSESFDNAEGATTALEMTLIKAMIAASKADGNIDALEHRRLFEAIEKLHFTPQDKAEIFDAMAREITVQELADSVSLEEHKAEVYLSAYLAIEVDDQQERRFLNRLAAALNLPSGFAAYLEQQADSGIEA